MYSRIQGALLADIANHSESNNAARKKQWWKRSRDVWYMWINLRLHRKFEPPQKITCRIWTFSMRCVSPNIFKFEQLQNTHSETSSTFRHWNYIQFNNRRCKGTTRLQKQELVHIKFVLSIWHIYVCFHSLVGQVNKREIEIFWNRAKDIHKLYFVI